MREEVSSSSRKVFSNAILLSIIFLTSFISITLLNPIIKSSATSLDSSLEISIDTVLSMSQSSDTISIDVTPTSDGAFGIGSNTYTVSTNNITGYTLSLSDSDTNTSLTHVADNTINIPTLEETLPNVDKSSFTKDKWGISIDYTVPANPSNPSNIINGTGTFNPIPASNGTSFTLSSTNSPSTSTTNLTIGSKISTDKASGLYTDTLIVSAIANDAPTYHHAFNNITTMQEMTPEICSAENTPSKEATALSPDVYPNGWILTGDTNTVTQATLTDTRDGKTYVVRKLANGTCWMSQNLDLDLVANEPVEAYDFSTGETYNFIPENTTQTTTGTTWTKTGTEGARSYDNGNKYCIGDTGDQDCTATSSTDPTDHMGNYYNWPAATAGTGTSELTNTEVSGSICPKGWRLPANTSSDTKSFANLFDRYNIKYTGPNVSDDNPNSPSILVEKSPLSFIRSGYYYFEKSMNNLNGRGTNGHYWSSMSRSTATDAYNFYFHAEFFILQNGYYKGNGLSIRCVAV